MLCKLPVESSRLFMSTSKKVSGSVSSQILKMIDDGGAEGSPFSFKE